MEVSTTKRNLILGILFFLPVAFVIIMLLSKDNYNPLDIVKTNVLELPKNQDNIVLEDHITVLAFFGAKPMHQSIAALNLKELIYDRCKGFKKFQIVVVLPITAKEEAQQLLKEIKSYEDLRFWHFVFVDNKEIQRIHSSLKTQTELSADLATHKVYIIDKDLCQRGRLDDRTEKEVEDKKPVQVLYEYDCIQIAELKNKMSAEDMRVLFTEYRQKRKGDFDDSNTRRNKDIKQKNEQKN